MRRNVAERACKSAFGRANKALVQISAARKGRERPMKVIPAGSILLNVSVTLAVALFVVFMPWIDQKVCARLGVSPWRGSGDDQQAARVLRMREVALCVILLAYLAIFAYIVFFSRSASEDYRQARRSARPARFPRHGRLVPAGAVPSGDLLHQHRCRICGAVPEHLRAQPCESQRTPACRWHRSRADRRRLLPGHSALYGRWSR